MAKKSKKNSDPKILRNYDPQSMEKRVYDMDHSPQRSYDLFSLEKRIYDLETGGGPTPPTPVEITTIVRDYGDELTGSYTFDSDKSMTLWTAIGASGANGIPSFHFKKNGVDLDLTDYHISNVDISNGAGYDYYANIPFALGDVISWECDYANRYFIMFG